MGNSQGERPWPILVAGRLAMIAEWGTGSEACEHCGRESIVIGGTARKHYCQECDITWETLGYFA